MACDCFVKTTITDLSLTSTYYTRQLPPDSPRKYAAALCWPTDVPSEDKSVRAREYSHDTGGRRELTFQKPRGGWRFIRVKHNEIKRSASFTLYYLLPLPPRKPPPFSLFDKHFVTIRFRNDNLHCLSAVNRKPMIFFCFSNKSRLFPPPRHKTYRTFR